jgi:hypothetical protein
MVRVVAHVAPDLDALHSAVEPTMSAKRAVIGRISSRGRGSSSTTPPGGA